MNEHSDQIAAMLAGDAPAARDLSFEIALLARIEQRRHRRGQQRALALAVGATLLLAFLMPQLDRDGWANALSQLGGNASVMSGLMLAAFAAWYFRPGARV
jgi:hypothetical protein